MKVLTDVALVDVVGGAVIMLSLAASGSGVVDEAMLRVVTWRRSA
jgi:hypothetical protein